MDRSRIVIVTPALADANNGNWQTARRWSRMLSRAYRVRLASAWTGDAAGDADDDVMIALHARRSASSVARWKASRPHAPVLVVLTGTDLYGDLANDAAILALADRLLVLNALGARALPAALRSKVDVVVQSATARRPLDKTTRRLRALTVGHLRDEKSPRTLFAAVRALADRDDLFVDHIGSALDPVLGAEARALTAEGRRYRWRGGIGHAATRGFIQRAHVLVHPSRVEGGAHVVIEAVRSGTPVIASRIDGNVGLLGDDYAGYFPVGDARALAALLRRLRDDPAMLGDLRRQCAALAGTFDAVRESRTLHAVVAAAVVAATVSAAVAASLPPSFVKGPS